MRNAGDQWPLPIWAIFRTEIVFFVVRKSVTPSLNWRRGLPYERRPKPFGHRFASKEKLSYSGAGARTRKSVENRLKFDQRNIAPLSQTFIAWLQYYYNIFQQKNGENGLWNHKIHQTGRNGKLNTFKIEKSVDFPFRINYGFFWGDSVPALTRIQWITCMRSFSQKKKRNRHNRTAHEHKKR